MQHWGEAVGVGAGRQEAEEEHKRLSFALHAAALLQEAPLPLPPAASPAAVTPAGWYPAACWLTGWWSPAACWLAGWRSGGGSGLGRDTWGGRKLKRSTKRFAVRPACSCRLREAPSPSRSLPPNPSLMPIASEPAGIVITVAATALFAQEERGLFLASFSASAVGRKQREVERREPMARRVDCPASRCSCPVAESPSSSRRSRELMLMPAACGVMVAAKTNAHANRAKRIRTVRTFAISWRLPDADLPGWSFALKDGKYFRRSDETHTIWGADIAHGTPL